MFICLEVVSNTDKWPKLFVLSILEKIKLRRNMKAIFNYAQGQQKLIE